ncbi:MAG: IS200/IS605 family transposase [Blastocatellales bacterium]|nr:IS200/IS605 family transposase [Blastocatellales bacterium]
MWRPKYRKAILGGMLAERLKELLYEKATELGAEIHSLEIQPDHVHMFVASDPTYAPAQIAAQFKGLNQSTGEWYTLRSPQLGTHAPSRAFGGE